MGFRKLNMMEFLKKMTRSRKPNWAAGLCGVVYLVFFLLFPVYSYWQIKLTGARLLAAAPLAWLMLVCALAMMACPLFLKRKICLWVGIGCVVITGLCGLFGNLVLDGEATMNALAIDINYSGYRPTHTMVDAGYLVCLGAALVFCVMEWLADRLHRKKSRFLDKHGNQIYHDRNGNEMRLQ